MFGGTQIDVMLDLLLPETTRNCIAIETLRAAGNQKKHVLQIIALKMI